MGPKDLNNIIQTTKLIFLFRQSSSLSDQRHYQQKKNFLDQQERQRLENYHNYLYLWIEILISTIKNWHKYKNIVKLVDFLISYSFNKETGYSSDSNEQIGQGFINAELLNEFMSYVRVDFGIATTETLTNYIVERSQSPVSSNDEELSISQDQMAVQPSNWMQPTVNWLSSSLYTVVNQTSTQLSGTVGAAIQAINTSGISFGISSGDFDSNQLQQFTYDKRLYKEFPYVGFYLSLCEERLESQLSLWSTFRSYLLGQSDFVNSSSDQSKIKSQSYIDSCWRKTLHTINKTHRLSLSFPAQRLMLFKWSERAVELPHDHPLLILYWQKFFNVYLDKDFYSSLTSMSVQANNNNHSSSSYDLELTATPSSPTRHSILSSGTTQQNSSFKSPTLKLFTSTSQLNSLLKQMKKQLELTSEHFAYRCHKTSNSR